MLNVIDIVFISNVNEKFLKYIKRNKICYGDYLMHSIMVLKQIMPQDYLLWHYKMSYFNRFKHLLCIGIKK